MGEVVNLRRARKRATRQADEAKAEANRARFGRSKGERLAAKHEADRQRSSLDGAKLSAPDEVLKRSLSINGHPTSISLEDEFWCELRRLAREDGRSLAALVAEIDAQRWNGEAAPRGLSSTLRVFVLQRLRARNC